MNRRFIIEGVWTGYTSAQQRVVHRTVHSGSWKKLRAWAEKTHAIRYTDGTSLLLTVRDAKPRERVLEIRNYALLISQCCFRDVNSVDALHAAEIAAKRPQAENSAEAA